MSEADFQKQVIELARVHGWRVAHFKTARMQSGSWATPVQADGKGFPDLVLARERIIFAELKTDAGKLRPDQELWLSLLETAGGEVHVWRPRDFDSIIAALKNVDRKAPLTADGVLKLLG